jgi:hypothetical protein
VLEMCLSVDFLTKILVQQQPHVRLPMGQIEIRGKIIRHDICDLGQGLRKNEGINTAQDML